MNAKAQLIMRPAGGGRGGATADDRPAWESWWSLLAASTTRADTVLSDLADLLLKWLRVELVAFSWLRGARTTRVTNRQPSGAP